MLVTGGSGFLGQALARELATGRIALLPRFDLVAYDLVAAAVWATFRGDILDEAALRSALRGESAHWRGSRVYDPTASGR